MWMCPPWAMKIDPVDRRRTWTYGMWKKKKKG